jgi:hypothetical protein
VPPLITKRLDVRPSVGNGGDPLEIPAELTAYCAALEDAEPTSVVTTSDPEQDTAQVHQCAVQKGSQVNAASYGLTVEWQPNAFHTVDPHNSSLWSNNINLRGVLYEAEMSGGATVYFCVCPNS